MSNDSSTDDKTVPQTYPVYIGKDEQEIVDWIEDRVESDDYHNYSHLFIKALKTLRRDESEEML